MSSTSVPDTAAPALPRPPGGRGLGNLRSMVISMVVILAAVVVWVAMVPRVREISQPGVDVTSVAMQVRRETGWAISRPVLPAGWKATNARFDPAVGRVGTSGTWHAGYLSPQGEYISIDQTAVSVADERWVSDRTSHGRPEGTLSAAGTTWRKLSSGDLVQRSLLSRGSGSSGSKVTASSGSVSSGLTTVLSGTASYAQLAKFAESLMPVPTS